MSEWVNDGHVLVVVARAVNLRMRSAYHYPDLGVRCPHQDMLIRMPCGGGDGGECMIAAELEDTHIDELWHEELDEPFWDEQGEVQMPRFIAYRIGWVDDDVDDLQIKPGVAP